MKLNVRVCVMGAWALGSITQEMKREEDRRRRGMWGRGLRKRNENGFFSLLIRAYF